MIAYRVLVAAVVACMSAPGCGRARSDFGSDLPEANLEALTDPAKMDPRTIPDRIRLLDSDDPAVRLFAIRSLERLTGQTLGYDHAAPKPERSRAVDRWVEWLAEREAADRGDEVARGADSG